MGGTTFHAAVFLIIRDAEGRILLHQRAGTEFLPGYWDFPSGHVEDDESFADAAVRELSEETALVTQLENLELVHASINHTDMPYINLIFSVADWSGTPTILEPHKCSGMEFFALDDLPAKLSLAVRNMLTQDFKPDLRAGLFVNTSHYEQIMGEPFELA